MSKITIIEPNTNDKEQVKAFMVKGEKGDSAYDLYVKNGGTLTEEEWLEAFLSANNYYTKTEANQLLGDKADADDVYTKTEANQLLDEKANVTALSNYKLNSDFAVITGSLTAVASDNPGSSYKQTQKDIDYPTGFSNTNSVCVAFGTTRTSKENEYNYDGSEGVAAPSAGVASGNFPKALTLKSDKIVARVYNYGSNDLTVYYKIVLLKIS